MSRLRNETLKNLEAFQDSEEWGEHVTSFDLPKRTITLQGLGVEDDNRKTLRRVPPPPRPRRRQRHCTTVKSMTAMGRPRTTPVPNQYRQRSAIPRQRTHIFNSSPSDNELKAAHHALAQAKELDRMRDTLLAFPEWIPVSQPMIVLTHEAKRFRRIAAQLIHCDPIELED